MESKIFEQEKQYLLERTEYIGGLESEVKEFLKKYAYNGEVHLELVGLFSFRDMLGYDAEEDIFEINFKVPKRIEGKVRGRDLKWERFLETMGIKYGVKLKLPHDFNELFVDSDI